VILRQTVEVPDNATKWLNHGRLPFWALYCSMPYRITQFLHSFLLTSFFLSSVLRSLQSLSSAELMKHCHGTLWQYGLWEHKFAYYSIRRQRTNQPTQSTWSVHAAALLHFTQAYLFICKHYWGLKPDQNYIDWTWLQMGLYEKASFVGESQLKNPQLAFSVEPCR